MRLSDLSAGHCRRAAGCLLAILLLMSEMLQADSADQFRPRRFRVDSIPDGAEVFVIGGHAGSTPLTLSERDIYPNWYPDEQAPMYGRIVLRKEGCAEFSIRVGLDHVASGIEAQLDCAQVGGGRDTVSATAPLAAVPAEPVDTGSPAAATAAVMQRRLRQLKVLEELLEDGLITGQEERTIRKRILESP